MRRHGWLLVAIAMGFAVAGSAEAKKHNLPKMTCEEFLALGDSLQPRAVAWLDGYSKGGKLKDKARLGVRFTSIVLADGSKMPIATEMIYREGESPTNESAAKIGGAAIGGAILGGILGGGKGAAIGGAIGAGGGSAAVIAGGRNAATLSSGSPVTVRLEEPATVTVERE